MILIALIACIVISSGSLAWGYWQAGFEGTARWIALFGFAWLVSYWRKWRWIPTPAVFASLAFAAFGVWFEFNPGWMFNGAVFALIAWDLTEFRQTIKVMPAREDIPGRTRRRILRISLLTAVGLVFVSLFLSATGQLAADWIYFLAGLFLLASLQAFDWKKR